MSTSVRVRRRCSLPGAGFDSAGNASQSKEQVVGKLVVTNYNRGGETLRPVDLGLTSLDYLSLQLEEGLAEAAHGVRSVVYSVSAQQFYVFVETGATEQQDEVAATSDPVVSFLAEGDAVRRPELL